MIPTPRTIHVEPGSELDRILREAGETPVELEQRGVRYRVTRVDDSVESKPSRSAVDSDSVLSIIGLGASREPTSIARHEREYLADAIDSARRR